MKNQKLWRGVQIFLAVVLLASGLRLLLIYRERHQPLRSPSQTEQAPLDADAYVVPEKLHAYDLKSARELIRKTVWVRAGYGVAFYPYSPASKRADFSKEAGVLAPIQKLEIKDVLLIPSPQSSGWQGPANARFRLHLEGKQVMAVFQEGGKDFAFPVGTVTNGDYHLFIDEVLYMQDPHQLYRHWPAATWQAIEQHKILPGMNELQASFAIGVPDSASDNSPDRTLHYPNGGHPLEVTYQSGKVASATDVTSR